MFWFDPAKGKMQKGKRENMYNTESMLPLSEIRSDTIILKDGWLRAILKIEWLNIDLKNADEQEIIVEQYKRLSSIIILNDEKDPEFIKEVFNRAI